MQKTQVSALATMVVLAMSIAACSSSDGGSNGGAAPPGNASAAPAKAAAQPAKNGAVDTCKIISRAEAAAALGEPVGAGEHDKDEPTACSWQATKYPPVSIVYVNLSPQFDHIYDHMNDDQVAAIFDIKKVSGLGDKAFTQSTKGDTGGSGVGDYLAVKQGSVTLSFSIDKAAMPKQQGFAADTVLAKAALGRL